MLIKIVVVLTNTNTNTNENCIQTVCLALFIEPIAIFKIILNAINFAHWICKKLLLENIQHFQKQSTKSKCTNKIFDSNSERGWMIYQLYQTNTSFPNIYFLKLSIIPKVHPKILLKMQQSTGYINTPWQTVSMKERFFFSVEFYLYLLNVYTQILL